MATNVDGAFEVYIDGILEEIVINLQPKKVPRGNPECVCSHSFNLHPIKACMNMFCVCKGYRPIKR